MALRELMRIIAGIAGGRTIKAPDTRGTRPATDRVREAVFSSLGGRLAGARVADLFAGSGSFGLEALSRGALECVFVENAPRAVRALRSNVASLGLGGVVVVEDVGRYLSRLERDRFDLVFIDPPWDLPSEALAAQLTRLDDAIAPGGRVVLSRRASDSLPTPPENWRVAADKRYGDTRILRYERLGN
jgi:16S rRNA (guanine966-N2)-methyltransferase